MENAVKITRLQENMKEANRKLDDLDTKIEKGFEEIKRELTCYVRKEEFATVKAIVYGLAGAVLTAFVKYLIDVVFK